MASRTRPGQQQVLVRMPVELHEQVKAVADEHDLSMAQVIRAAVRLWIKDPALVTQ